MPEPVARLPEFMLLMLYTGAYALVFTLIHLACVFFGRGGRWNRFDTLTMLWALVYAATGLYYAYPGEWVTDAVEWNNVLERSINITSMIVIPSLVTIWIAGRAWKTRSVRVCLAVGTVVAVVVSSGSAEGAVLFGPLVWNFAYLVGCILSCERASLGTHEPNH